jgi:hypothetical protein
VSLAIHSTDSERFWDSLSFDFADPEQGLFGLARIDLRPGARRAVAAGLLLEPDEEIESSRPEIDMDPPADWRSVEVNGMRIADDGERASVAVQGENASFELEVTRLGGSALQPGDELPGMEGDAQEAFSARVAGECRRGRSSRRIRCFGRIVRRASGVDWGRIELLRSLTAVLEDGSLLALTAARPEGAAGHADEAADAFLLDSDGAVTRFDEPLLSTEYDARERQRRAGVELPAAGESVPVRGAGSRICGASLELGAVRIETAFLGWALDGASGTARYDMLRGA